MIKGFDDKKLTPKQKARELIMDAFDAYCWQDQEKSIGHKYTEREKQLINDQYEKEIDRIAKRFGLGKIPTITIGI